MAWSPIRLFVVGTILLVTGPYFFVEGSNRQASGERLLREGRKAPGKVTGHRTGRSGGVDYGFAVEGRSYSGTSYMGRGHRERFPIGAPLEVTYLPTEPALSSIEPEEMPKDGDVLRKLGIPIALLGAALIGVGVWLTRR